MTFSREILSGPTLEAAHALIGARLVRDGSPSAPAVRRVGRIVEVEAYIGQADAASHARFGRTNRNGVMFGPAGVAYVYLVYGMYECLNVVTEADGRPAAILVRAAEPVEGAAAMRSARLAHALRRAGNPAGVQAATARLERLPEARLASGPGLLAAAFDITRADSGRDLLDPGAPLRLETGPAPGRVAVTARIGIGYAAEPWRSSPWRFLDPDSPAVSAAPGGART